MNKVSYKYLYNDQLSVPVAQAVLNYICIIGYFDINFQTNPESNASNILIDGFIYKYLKIYLLSFTVEQTIMIPNHHRGSIKFNLLPVS